MRRRPRRRDCARQVVPPRGRPAGRARAAAAGALVAGALDLRIAYEDEHLLVVDKPAGSPSIPARATDRDARARAPGRTAGGDEPERPGIVHRLDRDTSGLMVVARTEDAYRRLQSLVRRHELEREYLALVRGRPRSRSGRSRPRSAATGRADSPLARHGHPARRGHALRGRGARSPGTRCCGCGSRPAAHTRSASTWPRSTCPSRAIRLRRRRRSRARAPVPACRAAAFPHPITGEPVETESPLPPDLEAHSTRARGTNPASIATLCTASSPRPGGQAREAVPAPEPVPLGRRRRSDQPNRERG